MVDVLPRDEHNEQLVANVHPHDWENPTPPGRYNLVVIGAGAETTILRSTEERAVMVEAGSSVVIRALTVECGAALVGGGVLTWGELTLEGVVVAMADGFHKVTGKPAFVNVHTVAGTAQMTGQLYNANRMGSAMVVTAGPAAMAGSILTNRKK